MVEEERRSASQMEENCMRVKFEQIFEETEPSERKTKIICTLGQNFTEVD
jgi:hypothetical protein